MNLYRLLGPKGIQFDFLIHGDAPCDYEPEIRALGGEVYRLPARFNGLNGVAYRRWCREFFAAHPEHPIVHGHIGSSAAIYLDEANRAGRITIAHAHCENLPLSPTQLGTRFFSFGTRFVADWFLACSRAAGLDRFGRRVVEGPRFHVIANGINTEAFRCTPEDHREAKRRFLAMGGWNAKGASPVLHLEEGEVPLILGTVGRLTKIKNQRVLLGMVKRLNDLGVPTLAIIVGRGELEDTLMREARDLGIEGRCLFFGVTDDVKAILDVFDVFVLPSLKEGLPVAAVEAQAAGLPALISADIPEEAVLLGTTFRIDLAAGVDVWADAALEDFLIEGERIPCASEIVRKEGYDIHDGAEWLARFYESLIANGKPRS